MRDYQASAFEQAFYLCFSITPFAYQPDTCRQTTLLWQADYLQELLKNPFHFSLQARRPPVR